MREESWRAIEPGRTFDTVDVLDPLDPTKVIDQAIIKVEGQTMKHGTWNYYDPEWGTITKTEEYFADKLRTGDGSPTATSTDDEEDDELKPIDFSGTKKGVDTTGAKTTSKPQVVLDYEKKNSGKRKVRVRDGSTGQ